jgi:2,3,4,5-tetrahydropyridine-2-carboxylate N-succinyltransferase
VINIQVLKDKVETFAESDIDSLNAEKVLHVVARVIELLNSGRIRIAEEMDGTWIVNTWIKQAILLGFKFRKAVYQCYDGFDKFGLLSMDSDDPPRYRKSPGAIIREGVFIGQNAVIMPSYINIGAYIGDGTMVDINAAIGSCAQIGKNCHISALACIGGVLEPASARPVIIGDGCFIGAHSSILEGVIVESNAVIAAGTTISASTKIIDRQTGEITHGTIPAGSVLISGTYPSGNLNIPCAIIIKKVDDTTREKTSINEILRVF